MVCTGSVAISRAILGFSIRGKQHGIPVHQGKSEVRGVAHVVTPRMSKKERGFDAFPAELVPT